MTDTEENVDDLSLDTKEEVDEGDELEEEEEIYDGATFLSGPHLSTNCTLNENILEFNYSYGFAVRKLFNLAMPDPDHLIILAGNIIHILDVPNNTTTFRRSGHGGGIGSLRMNPNPEYKHLAMAENGNKFGAKPLIVIYSWPSFEIEMVLKGGSTASFTNLDYSPDGMLLVSQAGDPDYLITIYDWTRHTILLRSKSYVNDVFRVKFSESVPGQLCTSGVAHIKFWKMCNTFTGLKLKGEVGRFGKTEYTDIIGVLPMPDEKVVSGCKWGNLLVWEEGLIKVEVMRNNRKPMHEAQIVQIFYMEGELWTVSQDGHVKVWWYEKIDQADPPEEDKVVMLEPSYDFQTYEDIMLMYIIRRYKDAPDNYHYFAQDGNGGIWLIDCNVFDTPEKPRRFITCHAGETMDVESAPYGHYFASFGVGGRLIVYNYLTQKLIFLHIFPARGVRMIWCPAVLVRSADELILAFDDGNLRLCLLDIDDEPDATSLTVIQVIKAHTKAVTVMSINPDYSILVSGGADDTIFVFKLDSQEDCVLLIPIGYVASPDVPNCMTWKPNFPSTLAVGCLHGSFFEVELPTEPQSYTTVSYLLKAKLKIRKFYSYKSQIRRFIDIAKVEAKKAEKVEKKRKEMEKIKNDNPGFDIDEEAFLADSESSIKWDPLYIPEVPCDIHWMQYTPENTLWLSMSGYDAGYIYEYRIDQTDQIPLRYKMVEDADDVEISSFVYNYNKKYLIFAMQDGTIRINKVNPHDFRDLSDYWTLAMHENLNGYVPKMVFSYDEKYFFSCGHDGNVFAYTFHPPDNDFKPLSMVIEPLTRFRRMPRVPDPKSSDEVLSLEQAMIKAENDRITRVANENKEIYRKSIAALRARFSKILERNAALSESQRIQRDNLELDPRVTDAVHILFERKVALVRRKLAFDLTKADILLKKMNSYYLNRVDFFPITICGLVKDTTITCLRQKRLSPALFNMHAFIDMRIMEADIKGRQNLERPQVVQKAKIIKKKKAKELEFFLLTLSQSTLDLRLDAKFTRLLNKYRTRKAKWEARQEQWEEFMALQPIEGQNHPDDVVELKYAHKNIGDFKLKTSRDYKVTDPKDRETTLKKFRQILITRRKQFNIRHKFSKKVYSLRDKKEEIRKQLLKYEESLIKIQQEIPLETRKEGPKVPEQQASEHPEKLFQVIVRDENAEMAAEHEYMIVPQEQIPFVEEPDADTFEKELITGLMNDQNMDDIFQDEKFLRTSKSICEFTFSELVELSRGEFTPWEMELRAFRLNRMLFVQEETIQKMNDALEDFDDCLQNLNHERADALVDSFYCDLFLHKLHQELSILRNFEAHEEVLQDKVNAKMTNVLDMKDAINEVKSRIELQNLAIEKNLEQQGLLHEQFNKLVHDNKFTDFLRKVFKRRYKPPKVKHSEDSSSESSSSSSSESEDDDDAKSIDSRDFGFIKQDLNVCPKGCEQEIFDNTIRLRSERHQLEIGVKECQREIEGLKKDIELNGKKLKVLNAALQTSQDELASYQREKQKELNGVECTIMLNLDQMQHITDPGVTCPISECLVFSKTTLSKLYKRVGELQFETTKLRTKHLVNTKHLARMKTDLKYMQKDMQKLKQKIIDTVMIKFGKVVTMAEIDERMEKNHVGISIVNDLMEALLKKMVHELRLSIIDVKSLYKDEMHLWEKKIAKTETEYKEALKENTAKLDLLALLKKEKQTLSSQIAYQSKKEEIVKKRTIDADKMSTELSHLRKILLDQEAQIEEMKREIRSLKLKTKQPLGIRMEDRAEAIDDIERVQKYLYPEMIGEDSSDMLFPISAETLISERTTKKQEIIKSVMEKMLEDLEVALDKVSLEDFLKKTIYPIIDYASVYEIVKEIVNKIGIDPTEEQIEGVMASVEYIQNYNLDYADSDYQFQKKESSKEMPKVIAEMSTSEIKLYVGLVLDDILKDMMSKTEEFKYHLSFCNIMMRTVEEIPLEILKQEAAVDTISQKLSLCSCFSKDSLDKIKMAEVIQVWEECLCGSKDSIDKVELAKIDMNWGGNELEGFRKVVEVLLDRVFATGLDIITFHR